jgi:hypothetical protein
VCRKSFVFPLYLWYHQSVTRCTQISLSVRRVSAVLTVCNSTLLKIAYIRVAQTESPVCRCAAVAAKRYLVFKVDPVVAPDVHDEAVQRVEHHQREQAAQRNAHDRRG